MIKKTLLSVGIILLAAAVPAIAGTSGNLDYMKLDTGWEIYEDIGATHAVGSFAPMALMEDEKDSFSIYLNTYGDVVVFSFEDDNYCELVDTSGTILWSDILGKDEYSHISDLPVGIYSVVKIGSGKGISVLSGDPFAKGLGCWYAVNQYNQPLSTKLYTVGPKASSSGDELFAVFSYEDNNHVIVRNMDTEEVIWEGDLDSSEYNIDIQATKIPQVYDIEASYPVSVMTVCGVNGMYIPAFNGTFTGKNFMAYQHEWSVVPQDCQVIPWEDNTTVTMTEMGNPANVIKTETCNEKGDVKMFNIPVNTAVHIHSDKDISLSQTEWWSFGPDKPYLCGYYMVRGIDPDGLGLGKEFYLPIEMSYGESFSRLHVVAFSDSTDIAITRTPRDGVGINPVWEGTLNKGEYYQYTNGSDNEDIAVLHLVASKDVITSLSCNDLQGSDFFPGWVRYGQSTISEPNLITPVPVTELITRIGRQVVLKYLHMSDGLHADVFDASGRKVSEIHSPEQSGEIVWGQGYGPGVYFIRIESDIQGLTRKVVLIR
ncbi:hypothetical protein GF359_00040 [candidate division WOR-3 bacterium]|uniref:IgGFc-binding protein N-terminal domain-containing protein n=1 Tax=candidate division WOR-3 bacterium TaxID=2052148 RepID=A0A9D5QBK8_UNCW3|nr:hypothetical protein [candidate division WOR-3 bacterium]MBD3363584.1 hypothetical protein [candidate division WOR-3 bacterium]